jgi:hypothetical protein
VPALNQLLVGVALVAVAVVATAATAAAQVPPNDTSATGELLGGGSGAQVNVGFRSSSPGDNADGRQGRSNSNIVCRLTFDSGSVGNPASLTRDQLQAAYDREVAQGGTSVAVVRVCADQNGNIVSAQVINWTPATPVAVDPAALAATARSWLQFPAPAGDTSPPMRVGTVAQLPTYLFIDNWAPVSQSASAGPVTATVTATPTAQTWKVGGRTVASCDGPGALVETGQAVPADACTWVPEHSSAGQRTRSPAGEPCTNVTVSIAWDVRWTSVGAGGAGGTLAPGTSQATACIVVAEVQAVVRDAG